MRCFFAGHEYIVLFILEIIKANNNGTNTDALFTHGTVVEQVNAKEEERKHMYSTFKQSLCSPFEAIRYKHVPHFILLDRNTQDQLKVNTDS